MKKYKVSLAVLVPQNYEITIKAKSRKAAIEKAIEDLNGDLNGDFVDISCADFQEDFDATDESGIHVEKC
jgi:hypothetical protein